MSQIFAAIVEPVGGHGGMNFYDFGLCRGLVISGIHAELFTCDETQVPDGLPFTVGRPFRRIYGDDSGWLRGIRYVRGACSAVFSARRRGAEIFHFHFFHIGLLELFDVILARVVGGKVVSTAHDVEAFQANLSIGLFVRWVYRLSAVVVAHNEVSRRELVGKYGISQEKIRIIPHGNYVDFVKKVPAQRDARGRIGVPSDGILLLFFGQIKEVKGLDLLLEALPRVRAECQRLHLLIAGKVWKDDFLRYQAIIDRRGLTEYVTCDIRYIPDDEVATYYAAADLVVCPYRRIYQSGVVLMAMSFSKPVIASNIPGMREVIVDGETGFLFASESVDSLADTLLEAVMDSEKRNEVARNARALMEDQYSWEHIGRLTAECYEGAVQRL